MSRPHRWIGLWLIGILISGCTSSTEPEAPDRSISFDRSLLGEGAMFFPDDLLTGEATDLDLEPVRDRNATVTTVVNSRGGEISATGSDGTEYTLLVPPGAVAMPTEVTMTPLDDAEGLPFDRPPENRLGVEFGPDGLQLATPAALMVETPRPVDPGALTMGYRRGGSYTGAVASSEEGTQITAEIDHFSGYVMVWPLTEPDWKRVSRLRLDLAEWTLISSFTTALAFFRQQQTAGIETPNLLTLAENWLPEYEREVLDVRTRSARSGCGETEQAISAYVQYQRLTQLLGVAEDPRFARRIPDSLFKLQMDLCWEEAHIRCRVTGDFKSLVNYFLVTWRQYSVMTGEDPTEAMNAKALAYLRRCGHWRVTVRSLVDLVDANYPVVTQTFGLRYELELAWKPEDTTFDLGVKGSTIEGTGDVEIDRIAMTWAKGLGLSVEIEPGVVSYEPHAKLTELTFEQPDQRWIPGIKGSNGISVGGFLQEVGPPKLSGLTLELYVPAVSSFAHVFCPDTTHGVGCPANDFLFTDLWEWWDDLSPGGARLKALQISGQSYFSFEWFRQKLGPSPYGLRMRKGWSVCGQAAPYRPCVAPPFSAEQSLTDTGMDVVYGRHSIELDVEIQHAPQ